MRVRTPKDALLWILLTSLGLILSCDKATDPVERVGDVAGVVRNLNDQGIISGAEVVCDGVVDTSNAAGEFFLTGLTTGYNTLSANKPGYEPYLEGIKVDFHTDVDILLETKIYTDGLKGHVFLRGSTIPVADVLIICGSRSTLSAADGSYFLDSLKEGSYRLTAIKQDYILYETTINPDTISKKDILFASTALTGQVYSRVDGPISAARVSVTGLTADTDGEGRFVIPVAPQGNHIVSVAHPGYGTESTEVKIQAGRDDLDFMLKRDIYDTIDVSNDANIVWTNFDGCPDCPDWWQFDQGDDHDSNLRLEYFMRENPDGTIYAGYTRSLIQLPPPPDFLTPFDIDSAWLCLKSTGESYLPGTATARRAIADAGDWIETLVAWSSSPEVSRLTLSTIAEPMPDVWKINVRSVYRDSRDPNRTVRIQKEETGPAPIKEYLNFWSSEAPNLNDRPFVVLKYYY